MSSARRTARGTGREQGCRGDVHGEPERRVEPFQRSAARRRDERFDPAFRLAVNVSTTTLLDDRFHVLVNGAELNRLAFELTRSYR